MFQSLSGFLRPCNRTPTNRKARNLFWFQSLSGFLRPCNFIPIDAEPAHLGVSIPIGFSQALQRWNLDSDRHLQRLVSIPIGFSQALQRWFRRFRSGGAEVFQSLSGFLRPCNALRYAAKGWPVFRFNPYRVFSGLATRLQCASVRSRRVSIPIGFSQALQRSSHRRSVDHSVFQSLSGFLRPCNDVRVTSSAAVVSLFQSLSGFLRPCNGIAPDEGKPGEAFQSLSGFLRPCNQADQVGAVPRLQEVSIPIGFSQALQHCYTFSYLAKCSVSIPIGFSQALQQGLQSRSGTVSSTVSIPIGFSQALQRKRSGHSPLYGRVSIPIGFSQALQR